MVADYPWYDIIDDLEILQGEIIMECPIMEPPTEIKTGGDFEARVSIYNVIILSQSCDLVARKISLVLVCPFWTLEQFAQRDATFGSNERKENLRRGDFPGFHLLNKCTLEGFETDYLVVDFRNVYAVPITQLLALAKQRGRRLRLLPPYREHLSQAFARFFMRVGLPTDIPSFI
jgi:hypothetical protein